MSEYASIDDFKVDQRPKDVKAGNFGTIQVRPMSYGDVEDQFGDMADIQELETEDMVELLNRYVREPDMSSVTPEQVRENFHPLSLASILEALLEVNGMGADVDVDGQGNAQVDVQDVDT